MYKFQIDSQHLNIVAKNNEANTQQYKSNSNSRKKLKNESSQGLIKRDQSQQYNKQDNNDIQKHFSRFKQKNLQLHQEKGRIYSQKSKQTYQQEIKQILLQKEIDLVKKSKEIVKLQSQIIQLNDLISSFKINEHKMQQTIHLLQKQLQFNEEEINQKDKILSNILIQLKCKQVTQIFSTLEQFISDSKQKTKFTDCVVDMIISMTQQKKDTLTLKKCWKVLKKLMNQFVQIKKDKNIETEKQNLDYLKKKFNSKDSKDLNETIDHLMYNLKIMLNLNKDANWSDIEGCLSFQNEKYVMTKRQRNLNYHSNFNTNR